MNENLITVHDMKHSRAMLMGLAMLLIVLCHCGLPIANEWVLTKVSSVGVDIFLVLSGFGMYFHIDKNPDEKYGKYIWGRLRRIYPAFFVVVLLFTVISNIEFHYSWWNLPLNLSGIYIFTDYFVPYSAVFNWYIPFAMVLYAITPIIVRVVKKIDNKVKLVLLFSAIFVVCVLFNRFVGEAFYPEVCRFPSYVGGICIAHILSKFEEEKKGFSTVGVYIFAALISLILYFTAKLNLDFLHLGKTVSLAHLYSLWAPVACLALSKIMPYIDIKGFFTLFGKYSLEIYLLNICYTRFIKNHNLYYSKYIVLIFVLLTVAEVVLAVLLHKGIDKAMNMVKKSE